MRGRRVTVVGLGRFGGGVGVTRWLCGQGARVTVSDRAEADSLADSIAQLEGCDVELHLGGHEERDFLSADLLVVNPAVSKDMPLIKAAEAAGVGRTSEINLFLQRCPAPAAGVTGSVGKSTTAAMTGAILSRKFTAHVGGNIGVSLLEDLENIRPDHVVVLELSSFQLEDLPIVGISPHVAVVTNVFPHHLDRHGSEQRYIEAKKNIFAYQRAGDVLVLNAADPIVSSWAGESPGAVAMFDPAGEPFELVAPGAHNQANAQAAWAAARQFGVERAAAAEALRTFAGLPHRLELVATRGGVRYVNDSKCTTPQGAVAAMEAFEAGSVVAIVGGYDKGADFGGLGKALAGRAKAVITMGPAGERIAQAVRDAGGASGPAVVQAEGLEAAVRQARELAADGDVVLLSPGCASYDEFDNYEQRGRAFGEMVGRII